MFNLEILILYFWNTYIHTHIYIYIYIYIYKNVQITTVGSDR